MFRSLLEIAARYIYSLSVLPNELRTQITQTERFLSAQAKENFGVAVEVAQRYIFNLSVAIIQRAETFSTATAVAARFVFRLSVSAGEFLAGAAEKLPLQLSESVVGDRLIRLETAARFIYHLTVIEVTGRLSYLLQEDGFYLLQEDSGRLIIEP